MQDDGVIQRMAYSLMICGLTAIPYYWASQQVGIGYELAVVSYGFLAFGIIMTAVAYETEEPNATEVRKAKP